MTSYKVEVTRDDRWWMIYIPDIDELTQARRIGEVELMARELIAVSTDQLLNDISVTVTSITVAGMGDVATTASEAQHLREEAQRLEQASLEAAKRFAQGMTEKGVPVRDVAELLGVSPQRISQLANATPNTPQARS